MTHFTTSQVVSDEEIKYFMPNTFGDVVDNNVSEQREQIIKSCQSKLDGYHVGHTIFHVMVSMGLVPEGVKNSETRPTERGMLFLRQEIGHEIVDQTVRFRLIHDSIDHVKYLNKHLEQFLIDVTGKGVKDNGLGSVSKEDVNNGLGYSMFCQKRGVPFPHLMLILMLSRTSYCNADLEKVRVMDWIVEQYKALSDKLPEININDPEVLKSSEPEDDEDEYEED